MRAFARPTTVGESRKRKKIVRGGLALLAILLLLLGLRIWSVHVSSSKLDKLVDSSIDTSVAMPSSQQAPVDSQDYKKELEEIRLEMQSQVDMELSQIRLEMKEVEKRNKRYARDQAAWYTACFHGKLRKGCPNE